MTAPREPTAAPSLRTELAIVLAAIVLAIPASALLRWYMDWAAADAVRDQVPAVVRTPTLDCRAPSEHEIVIVTIAHRDGRVVVGPCNYVRGSDRARKDAR